MDDVNGGYLPEDLVLTTRREEIEWVYAEGADARVLRCRQETVGADLGGHGQVCGLRAEENSIETVCQGIPDEEARLDSKFLTCL